MVDVARRPFRWKMWLPVILVALVCIVGIALMVPRVYQKWQVKRLVASAQEHAAAGRTADAMVLARRILQIDPANSPAFRLVADAEEAAGSPEAYVWRERLMRMNPGSFDDLIACAKAALAFRSASVAAQALSLADEKMKVRPEYLEIAGDVAMRFNDRDGAEKNYAAAVKANPKAGRAALKLAVVRVQSKDDTAQREALASLESLAKEDALKLDALRALVRGWSAVNEWRRAIAYADRLIADPKSGFGDRLLHLSGLLELRRPEFGETLEALQKQASTDPASAGLTIAWMQNHGMISEAIAWGSTLPREMTLHPRVGASLAPCLIIRREWPSLEALLQGADWGRLSYLRLLFSARLHREKGDDVLFRGFWEGSLQAAGGDPQSMNLLGQIVQEWGWTELREEFLWAATALPELRWSIRELEERFSKEGDAVKLRRLMVRKTELNPGDLVAQNNFAMLGLLLGDDAEVPLRTAEQLHKAEPENAAFTSTLAFALMRAGKAADALALFRSIPAETLSTPAFAGFYGLILEANADPVRALEYLRKAKDGKRLKEEAKLIEEALARLGAQR